MDKPAERVRDLGRAEPGARCSGGKNLMIVKLSSTSSGTRAEYRNPAGELTSLQNEAVAEVLEQLRGHHGASQAGEL
jgi:hypothetical protein